MKVSNLAVLVALSVGLALPVLAKSGKDGCGGGGHAKEEMKGCGMGSACQKPAAAQAEISTEALATLLASGAKVTVLDARTGKFDDGRRIPGAKSLAPDATAEQAAALIPAKDAAVVTYCSGVKCPASAALAKQLRSLGYVGVLEYPQGIAGWADAGKEVQKAN